MNKCHFRSRARLLVTGSVFIALIAVGIYLQPGFCPPSPRQTGDASVVSFLTPLLKGSRGSVAAALITPRGVQYALWDSDYNRQYEIASLTKTMTSSLLIDAFRRGEATAQTRVGDLIPEISGPAREIPLEQLASHRSGLPPLASSLRQKMRVISKIILRENFWEFDEKSVIEMVNNTRLATPASFDYSNTGYALLGLALSRAAHQPFNLLLQTRVFAQAKMTNSVVAEALTPDTPMFHHGWAVSGFAEAPWIQHAFTPAAGVRSTIVDMAHYAQALLAGKLAGSAAMQPRFDTDDADSRVGYAWFTTRIRGRDIVWHDGESSGFASVIAVDPQQQSAVVILSDTAWPVIVPAMRLLLTQTSAKTESHHELG
ncbi:TPA: serine hydrolase domain-containing protein [Klebsiella variicola subsp. variicola]|uniref:D-alanyl-D-alanine carboxypeptidase n=1 Tax=Klebsiella variicola TaxID=244366 RepID=A0A9P0VAP5_KLEVA|nr:serine hydrolase domain-containing protein [Klebsiella variicola]NWO63213.1 beta-lactamase family protein [Klebsiella variicola]CAH6246735.1 D-alanyl-D-alanine carboxypeptidase [Klebsiella variicola]HDZ9396264.1 beta-lactamase family protein [Klebsiella variicola subsp. variicola]